MEYKTMNDQSQISERVVSAAKRIEGYDTLEDVDPLDVKLTVGLDGTVREITLILTTGGPHIELNVSNGTITGSWGGSHTTHVNNEQLCNRLHDHYAEMYRMQN